jgi:hypothetical protein
MRELSLLRGVLFGQRVIPACGGHRYTDALSMRALKSYARAHYRLPLSCPVMFAGVPFVGEAQLRNLTVIGCGMDCGWEMPVGTHLRLRLLLPDQSMSLAVEIAAVRWTEGTHAGLEFLDLPQPSKDRLHCFVLEEFARALNSIR